MCTILFLYRLIRTAIEMLVLGVINAIEPELSKMSKVNWATFEHVGDQSEYVFNIVKQLNEHVTFIGDTVPKSHFKFFCDSFVLTFVNGFISYVFKIKKLTQSAAQQLLLDMTALGNTIKNLVNVGRPGRFDEEDTQAFAKQVATMRISKAESVLKVLISHIDAFAETYISVMQEGSKDDLSKLMDLRGFTKNEKTPVLDKYEKLVKQLQQQQQQQTVSPASGSSPAETPAWKKLFKL